MPFDLTATVRGAVTRNHDNVVATAGTTVTISANRPTNQVAPEGIIFTIALSGFDTNTQVDQTLHDAGVLDKSIFWISDEEYFFTAPEQIDRSKLNCRFSRGFAASRTFRTPGSHTVKCVVYEHSSGKIGVGTWTGTVADPNTLYATNGTIYVDPDASYGAAPAGATTTTTLASAVSTQNAATKPTRIMLSAGKVHEISARLRYNPSNNASNTFRIEAAPGARPTIQCASGFTDNQIIYDQDGGTSSDIVISGVRINGLWDAATETGQNSHGLFLQQGTTEHVCFDDVIIDGVDIGIYPANAGSADLIINDTVITNWQDYGGLLVQDRAIAITGSRIMQKPSAKSGNAKVGSNFNNHGPARTAGHSLEIINKCDFFSCTGWFPLGSMQDLQPCYRFNTDGLNGARLVCTENIMEGGSVVVNLIPVRTDVAGAVVTVDLDANVFMGCFQTRDMVKIGHGGIRIRNNQFIRVDAPNDWTVWGEDNGGNDSEFIRFVDTYPNTNGYLSQPVVIESNTFASNLSAANARSGGSNWQITTGVGNFTAASLSNNIEHQPKLATPDVPFAPMVSSLVLTPRYEAYKRSHIKGTIPTTDLANGATIDVDISTFPGVHNITSIADINTAKCYVQNGVGGATIIPVTAFSGTTATFTNNTGGTLTDLRIASVEFNTVIEHATSATPATEGLIWRPATGSSALGGATGTPPMFDFNGVERASPADVGAVQT